MSKKTDADASRSVTDEVENPVATAADDDWQEALAEKMAHPYNEGYAKAGDLTLWSQRDYDVANAAHVAVIATMLKLSRDFAANPTPTENQDGGEQSNG